MRPPNLEAELAAALGRQCEVSAHEIARAMDKDGAMPVGLRRALINALNDKDSHYQIKIIRKNVGRPSVDKLRSQSAQQVSEFVEQLVLQGSPQKAAVADACIKFRCSRATIYTRMREWRQISESKSESHKLREQILSKAKKSGKFKNPNKRTKRRGKRFSGSKYLKHRKSRESERQKRSKRLSRKRSQ